MKARADIIDDELLGLGALVQLARRARSAATIEELGFIAVNETHQLAPYRQAVLWRRDGKGTGAILAVSGVPAIERDAPFGLWLGRVLAECDGDGGGVPARAIGAADLPAELGREWADWLPGRALWLTLPGRDGAPLGALLLARDQPWQEGEGRLLVELADIYGHAWAALRGPRRYAWRRLWHRSHRLKAAIALALVGLLFLPVTQSALAPAEVVPLEPAVVRAPLDGVIEQVVVQPNQEVKADQLLLTLDPNTVQNRLEVARKALDVAEAEYRQAAQQSLVDDKSRSQLAALQGRLEQGRAEAAYVASLLDRLSVKADRPGIAVFEDRNDWTGRPVTIGERILTIADPSRAELEIRLSVPDAITLEPGAPVAFFLNVAPERPIHAVLRYASYEATPSPDGVLSYRLKATLAEGETAPRIGLKGTAKIYGHRVSLFYFLMRRPLAAVRQVVGL
jgi:hypothetical protein